MSSKGNNISGVESGGVWKAKVGLVLELRKRILDVLVRDTAPEPGKMNPLERGEKGQVFSFFVLESSEKKALLA